MKDDIGKLCIYKYETLITLFISYIYEYILISYHIIRYNNRVVIIYYYVLLYSYYYCKCYN